MKNKYFGKSLKYETQFDKMTREPIGTLVLKLGIPTTLSMLVTSIYNMVDTMFVGFLGTSASGAVGVVFGYMAIIQAFGFMYGQGAGSIISRRLGSKDNESATRIASTSFFMALLTGLIISVLSLLFLNPLLYLLGSTDTILPYAKDYVFYIIIAAPFMMATFTLNNILRFEGKASLAMIGLMAGGLLNMVLDPILMFVCDMGIAGAGFATAFSQMVSFSILLTIFLLGKTQSKLSIRKITKSFGEIWDIIATGFPSLVRQGFTSIATMVLNQQARVYGDYAVSAMSIVSRVNMFIFSFGLGVGQGYQPVVGFNYGAKRYDRVKQAFKFTWVFCEALLGVLAVMGLIIAPNVIAAFRNDPEVIAFGTPSLYYHCIVLFLQPLIVLSNMTLQSTGQKASATFISMLRSGIYFIPMILILPALFGELGIQIAQPVADVLTFLTSVPVIWNFMRKLPKTEIRENI